MHLHATQVSFSEYRVFLLGKEYKIRSGFYEVLRDVFLFSVMKGFTLKFHKMLVPRQICKMLFHIPF